MSVKNISRTFDNCPEGNGLGVFPFAPTKRRRVLSAKASAGFGVPATQILSYRDEDGAAIAAALPKRQVHPVLAHMLDGHRAAIAPPGYVKHLPTSARHRSF
jgi:hypothetical protein